jgi:hypothetical protein
VPPTTFLIQGPKQPVDVAQLPVVSRRALAFVEVNQPNLPTRVDQDVVAIEVGVVDLMAVHVGNRTSNRTPNGLTGFLCVQQLGQIARVGYAQHQDVGFVTD